MIDRNVTASESRPAVPARLPQRRDPPRGRDRKPEAGAQPTTRTRPWGGRADREYKSLRSDQCSDGD
jgi:hypothetical protein